MRPRRRTKPCVISTKRVSWPCSMPWVPKHLPRGLAQPPVVARDLLRKHQETYRDFWRWSDAAVDHAMAKGALHTVFGWTVHVGADQPKKPDRNHIASANPRSLRNFPDAGKRR